MLGFAPSISENAKFKESEKEEVMRKEIVVFILAVVLVMSTTGGLSANEGDARVGRPAETLADSCRMQDKDFHDITYAAIDGGIQHTEHNCPNGRTCLKMCKASDWCERWVWRCDDDGNCGWVKRWVWCTFYVCCHYHCKDSS